MASVADLSDPVLDEFVNSLLPRLREEWRAQQVILFGSRARGDGHEWSDVDVVVVSPLFRGQRFIDRGPAVLTALGCPAFVEPLCYTPEEFERQRNEPGIVAMAVREGIRLL